MISAADKQAMDQKIQVEVQTFQRTLDDLRREFLTAFTPADPNVAKDPRAIALVAQAVDVAVDFMVITAALTARGQPYNIPAIMALSTGLPSNSFWQTNVQYLSPIMVVCNIAAVDALKLSMDPAQNEQMLAGADSLWMPFVSGILVCLGGAKLAMEQSLNLKRRLLAIF